MGFDDGVDGWGREREVLGHAALDPAGLWDAIRPSAEE